MLVAFTRINFFKMFPQTSFGTLLQIEIEGCEHSEPAFCGYLLSQFIGDLFPNVVEGVRRA